MVGQYYVIFNRHYKTASFQNVNFFYQNLFINKNKHSKISQIAELYCTDRQSDEHSLAKE